MRQAEGSGTEPHSATCRAALPHEGPRRNEAVALERGMNMPGDIMPSSGWPQRISASALGAWAGAQDIDISVIIDLELTLLRGAAQIVEQALVEQLLRAITSL